MFLGQVIYETLNENGELTSYIMTPSYGSERLIVDTIDDVNRHLVRDAVDIGPLRIYAQKKGIGFNLITSNLGGQAFNRFGNSIELNLKHSNIPIKPNNAGYYGLLFPKEFAGDVNIDISVGHDHQAEYAKKVWLEDTKQIFISSDFRVYGDQRDTPTIVINSKLTKGATPSSNFKISSFKDCLGGLIDGLYDTSISNFINEINKGLSTTAPQMFICHSSIDKPYARKLAQSLSGMGIKVWIDEAEIKIGDSLISKIESGILSSNNLVIILTPNSVSSSWCKEELRMALAMQINNNRIKVLPALFADCDIPGFLIEKTYADFRSDKTYTTSLNDIYNAVAS